MTSLASRAGPISDRVVNPVALENTKIHIDTFRFNCQFVLTVVQCCQPSGRKPVNFVNIILVHGPLQTHLAIIKGRTR